MRKVPVTRPKACHADDFAQGVARRSAAATCPAKSKIAERSLAGGLLPARAPPPRRAPLACRAASASMSKSSISSWNIRCQFSSAPSRRNTLPSPIAERSISTNSRGGRTPPVRLQAGMHLLRHLAAVLRIVGLLDAANAGPATAARRGTAPTGSAPPSSPAKIDEAPAFVGVVRLVVVTVAHRLVEVDHAAHEFRPRRRGSRRNRAGSAVIRRAPGNCPDAGRRGSRRSGRAARTRRGTAPRRCGCAPPGGGCSRKPLGSGRPSSQVMVSSRRVE